MFDFLRRRRKSITALILVGFVALLMVSFGIGDVMTPRDTSSMSIKIGEHEIPYRKYLERYNQTASIYRRQFGENFSKIEGMLNIGQQTVDTMIDETLVDDFTRDLGLYSSGKQIRDALCGTPFFKDDCSQLRYSEFLRQVNMSAKDLEDATRQDLVRRQLATTFTNLSFPSDTELEEVFYENERSAKFLTIKLPAEELAKRVEVSDDALKKYFEENEGKYQHPTEAKFSFVKFAPAAFKSKVELTEEDVQVAYADESDRFLTPKRYQVRQILLKIPGEQSELEKMVAPAAEEQKEEQSSASPKEQAKEKADKILERLNAGEDFAAVARDTSEAPSAANGGDLGWQTSDALGDVQRTAIKSLDVGELTNVLETPAGFEILRLDNYEDAKPKPLEQVRGELEDELRTASAPVYAQESSINYFENWKASGKSLAEYSNEYPVESSGSFVSVRSNPKNYPPELLQEILDAESGDKKYLEIGDEYYVVQVEEVHAPVTPPIEEVKIQLEADYRKEQAIAYGEQFGRSLLDEAKAIAGPRKLAALAARKGLTTEETQLVKYIEAGTLPYFQEPRVRSKAYALTTEQPLLDEPVKMMEAVYLLEILEVVPAKEDDFQKKLKELRREEAPQAGQRMMLLLVENLKKNTDVWVDPELLARE